MNRRDFGSHYELKTLLGIGMLVMIMENMFAHKIMAMYERVGKTSRDIYDVWFFLKNNWPINKEIIAKHSDLPWKKIFHKCIEQVQNLNDRKILTGLGESLSRSQKDWARAKLKDEAIFF